MKPTRARIYAKLDRCITRLDRLRHRSGSESERLPLPHPGRLEELAGEASAIAAEMTTITAMVRRVNGKMPRVNGNG